MPPIGFDIKSIDLARSSAWAFLISLVLTPIFRDIFRAYNVVDRPGRRKVHAYPIPRLGGIAIASGVAFALLMWMRSVGFDRAFESSAWKIVPGAAVIFLTGLLDDLFSLSPAVKLFGQIAAAGFAIAGGLSLEGMWGLHLPVWLSVAIAGFWLLLTTNALNLIDGLDGLCASMGLAGAATFVFLGHLRQDPTLPLVAAILCGALLGFLIHNFNPATIFLGDSGALLVGFLLGCFGLIWVRENNLLSALSVPLLALSVPLIDVGLAVARRFLSGRSIGAADRAHLHHRLLDRGWSPRRVVVMLMLWSTLCGLAAYGLTIAINRTAHILVLLGLLGIVGAGIWQLRYAEFEVAARLIFQSEFRRTLRWKARAVQLREALQHAPNEAAWWDALTSVAAEANWVSIRWLQGSAIRRTWSNADRAAEWTFEVGLGDQDTVQIGGLAHANAPALDLTSIAEAIRSSFALHNGSFHSAPSKQAQLS